MFGLGKKINEIKPFDSGCFNHKKGEGIWKDLKDNDNNSNKLNYVLEESRIYYENVIDNRNRLIQKELFLLALIVGLIGFIYNSFITQVSYFIENFELLLMLGMYFTILLWSFFGLAKHQLPSLDYPPGNPPKNILNLNDEEIKDLMKCDYERIVVRYLEDCQDCINQNEKRNQQIANDIKLYFWLLFISTATVGLTLTFYYYLIPPPCYCK
jgi:hypothetical protein